MLHPREQRWGQTPEWTYPSNLDAVCWGNTAHISPPYCVLEGPPCGFGWFCRYPLSVRSGFESILLLHLWRKKAIHKNQNIQEKILKPLPSIASYLHSSPLTFLVIATLPTWDVMYTFLLMPWSLHESLVWFCHCISHWIHLSIKMHKFVFFMGILSFYYQFNYIFEMLTCGLAEVIRSCPYRNTTLVPNSNQCSNDPIKVFAWIKGKQISLGLLSIRSRRSSADSWHVLSVIYAPLSTRLENLRTGRPCAPKRGKNNELLGPNPLLFKGLVK